MTCINNNVKLKKNIGKKGARLKYLLYICSQIHVQKGNTFITSKLID